MEASRIITISPSTGAAPIPTDYLVWRTVLWTGNTPMVEIDYVHPAYLDSTTAGADGGDPRIFTIEGSTFLTRPVNPAGGNTFQFHYYQKIPTITGSDLNTNWLLTEYPDAYLFGTLTELFGMGRNIDGAQLYKARRDEVFAEIIQLSALTTGATSSQVRRSGVFLMPAIYDDLGNEVADIPLSEKQQTVLDAGEEIVVFYHTPQLLRAVLGQQDGRFTLGTDGERITTTDPVSLKKYADLQRAIKAARENS